MFAHYGAQNVGKRERSKQEKIKKMENLLLELQGKLEKANKKVLPRKKMQMLKIVNPFIIKKGFTVNSEFTQANNNFRYYENLSMELQEEINNTDKNYICTFKNRK